MVSTLLGGIALASQVSGITDWARQASGITDGLTDWARQASGITNGLAIWARQAQETQGLLGNSALTRLADSVKEATGLADLVETGDKEIEGEVSNEQ